MISSRSCSHNILCESSTARSLAHTFQHGQAACRKYSPSVDKEDRQEWVPAVFLNSGSSWMCGYQVAQMLDRHRGLKLPTGWLLAAGVCLVTAVYSVTKCTTELRY